MKQRFRKVFVGLVCVLLVAAFCFSSTLAWQSLDQNARNDVRVERAEVDEPVLEKEVEGTGAPAQRFEFELRALDGAPLPDGESGDTLRFYLDGAGTVKLGKFRFDQTGTYRYAVTETAGSAAGWTFDATRYIMTFTVTEQEEGLVVSREITVDGGETASRLLFHNKYTSPDPPNPPGPDEPDPPVPPDNDEVKISGEKIWEHGSNPAENWPDSVVVYVYNNGELYYQGLVTAEKGWKYTFWLPKYVKGRRAVYTVGEKEVPGYSTKIDGYDIINTFMEGAPTPTPSETMPDGVTPTPSETMPAGVTPTPTETTPAGVTPAPEGSVPPEPSGAPIPGPTPTPATDVKTGDTGELTFWLVILVTGLVGMVLCLVCLVCSRRRYVGKRLTRR